MRGPEDSSWSITGADGNSIRNPFAIECKFGSSGRAGEIRTRDFLTPSQARYQAALRPDTPAGGSGWWPFCRLGGAGSAPHSKLMNRLSASISMVRSITRPSGSLTRNEWAPAKSGIFARGVGPRSIPSTSMFAQGLALICTANGPKAPADGNSSAGGSPARGSAAGAAA